MSVEERWIVFFRYLSDGTQGELLKELIHEEEGIAIARAEVVKISRNEAERAWLESQYKYELDRQSDLVSARRKGRAEGERLGLKKGLRETARSLQAMGLSPEQIAAATGLRPEELP
jgi:predicted transposase/invertase (TIGR01784 family)